MRLPAVLRRFSFIALIGASLSAPAATPPDGEARLEVKCDRRSAFVNISINSFRRIGVVKLEVRDVNGLVLYREEGKALTAELVRRLDKGTFPRGTHTLVVEARDMALSQPFTVE
jgi:hypothetical protein